MPSKTFLMRAAVTVLTAATVSLGAVAPANAATSHSAVTAVAAQHASAAKKLTTKQQVLKTMTGFKKNPYTAFTKQAQKVYTKAYVKKNFQLKKVVVKNKTYKFHNSTTNIDGKNYKQYATVTATLTYKNGVTSDYDFTLVKEKGKWKIAFIIWHF